MKKSGFILISIVFVLSAGLLHAQKIKSGDIKTLSGQKTINVTYDYSATAVGKFKTEKEYLDAGIADRNNKKPGSGDEWAAKWISAKKDRFEPAFEEAFNKQSDDCGMEIKADPTAKYTLVIRTNFVEQGVETVVMGAAKSAQIDLVLDLVETSSPDKILGSIEMDDVKPKSNMRMSVGGVPVSKEVYDPGARIAECYETGGKQIAKLICKQLK